MTTTASLRKRVTWVTMGPEPYLATCQRCGLHENKPRLPAPIESVVLILDAALAAHQFCKEPAVTEVK